MSSKLNLVLKNFIYRIESISPTNTLPGRSFRHIDPLSFDVDTASGITRCFSVFFVGSQADIEPTDMVSRIAPCEFLAEIAYSTDYDLYTLQDIVLQDRHDLAKELRDPAKYNGINSSNPTTDTGLYVRTRSRDSLDKDTTNTWYLRQSWICTIDEGEM